jgi:hypothetical protein
LIAPVEPARCRAAVGQPLLDRSSSARSDVSFGGPRRLARSSLSCCSVCAQLALLALQRSSFFARLASRGQARRRRRAEQPRAHGAPLRLRPAAGEEAADAAEQRAASISATMFVRRRNASRAHRGSLMSGVVGGPLEARAAEPSTQMASIAPAALHHALEEQGQPHDVARARRRAA